MKVLFVDQFGKTVGRETLALAELINSDEVKVDTYLADTTELPSEKKYTVNIYYGFHGAYEGNIVNKTFNYLKSLKELTKFLKKNEYDIVHLQWFSLPWIEWLYVAMLKKKAKVVITVHDVIPFDNRFLEMKALNAIYKRADRLLLHTKEAADEFRKYYSATTPISIITKGFCYKPDYKRIEKETARKKLGIPNDVIVFLYYGTIRPSKGLDTLMSAISQAQDINSRIFLLAAGAFHRVDEDKYRKLADEVVKKGAKVDFGFVPYNMEKIYFSSADVLVLPYREGTQSGVVQVGLMYELPIIASDIYAMDDVAVEGVNALRFHAGNVKDLKQLILKMADDSNMLRKYSIASKEIGEKDFSLEVKAERVRNAYISVLN